MSESTLCETTLQIVGASALQNKLLAGCLAKETGLACILVDGIATCRRAGRGVSLLLIDCLGGDGFDSALKGLTDWPLHEGDAVLPALFNALPGVQQELAAYRMGVRGYFISTLSLDVFVRGIKTVLNGELWFSREMMSTLLSSYQPHQASTPLQVKSGDVRHLSKREREVLSHVAAGDSNDEVASRLYISSSTVKKHLVRIYAKIGVPNRVQAALWATEHLLSGNGPQAK